MAHNARAPRAGQIGIFNRSYYEEVLIARVHPEVLHGEGLPPSSGAEASVWKGRFRSIVDLQRHLQKNGTVIIKFYLHISREEQRKRLLQRMHEPDKRWKFSMAHIAERMHWPQYMHAYAECLSATSAKASPWHLIPADDNRNARLFVSRIILDTLSALRMRLPKLSSERSKELRAVRAQLEPRST